MSSALLSAENVGYRYPKQPEPALQGVDLSLSQGQILGLLGPNGSGKSTLINVLIGLRAPLTGGIRHGGNRAPIIAWVPQELAFYPQLSCRENLQFFASLLDIPGHERAARVEHAIQSCALQEFAGKLARHCSGGMRRRLNMAIALLQEPEVLLLDEPTVGVDTQSRALLLEQVRQIAQRGTAVLYSTHYMEEVSAVCQDIVVLNHGRVIASGNLYALLRGNPDTGPFDNLEALFLHYTQRSLRE